jgi:alkanesulfonate monooxygenase SsuD/methylene tetrahydromethanopterin reductase-like flavin-dependent oxidoreductase (luciferase family)
VQLRIFTEPQQGATYDTLLTVARAAEDAGFDGFFRSDHFLAESEFATGGPGGLPAAQRTSERLGAPGAAA